MSNNENEQVEKIALEIESNDYDLGGLLDEDKQLTEDILAFLHRTGDSFDQICFGVVALARYYCELVRPQRPIEDSFYDFWIEPCEYDGEMLDKFDNAIRRAKARIDTIENTSSNDQQLF